MNFPKESVIELDDDDSSLLSSCASRKEGLGAANETSNDSVRIYSIDFISADNDPSMLSSPMRRTNTSDWSSSDDENFLSLSIGKGKPKSAPTKGNQQSGSYTDSDDDDDSLAGIKSKLTVSAVCRPYASLSQSSNITAKSISRNACTDRTNFAEKQAYQNKKNEERLRLRAEKEAAKFNAKMERERLREEKKNAQLAEKQSKKRDREVCQQASGKLAKKEIAVLLQKELFTSYTVIADLEQMGYFVQEYPSALQCNAVQWIRKDALQGGAEFAVQNLQGPSHSGYQHFHVLTIVVDNAPAFLKLLERSVDDQDEDDYPALEEWLKGIEYGWRAAWKGPTSSTLDPTSEPQLERPRIILLLVRIPEALDKLWVQYRKDVSSGRSETNSRSVPPTAEELHDAITWILIQFQIECVHCKSTDDVSMNICKVTRLLAESPYRQPITEFSCIKKIKGNAAIDEGTSLDRATDCWIRQLQQLPNISHARALHFASYYPTALSLWMAYQDNSLTIDEKRSLVAHCFHPTKSHIKLSNQLYAVMTSQDPNEMVN